MTKIFDLEMNMKAFDEWVAGRPPEVQAMIRRLPPDRLYLMKPTGQRVTIIAYAEDGTLRVNVSGEFNALTFERQVFGVKADDLEECDLPKEGEPLGAMLTEDADIKEFIDAVRPIVLAERDKGTTE